ncbi:MAG: ParA family protein [Thermoleophilaceae bacterium]|nr:ParA family protein [Thermoleophilaceae bacterium]
MAPKRTGARLLILVMGWAAFMVGGQSAWAQRDREPSPDRVQPPTELLEEYPFEEGGRLRSRARADARQVDAPSAQVPVSEPAAEGGEGSLQVIWLVLGAAAALLALAVAGRRVLRTAGGGAANVPAPKGESAPPPATAPPTSGSGEAQAIRGRADRPPKNSYAVVNQKGGVGKTTVSLALGAAAVRRGSRVLLLDLDPQASATSVLGADVEEGPTLTDVMLGGDHTLRDAVRATGWGLDLAPADRKLRAADTGVVVGDEAVLPRQLKNVDDYDLILLDCPPNLGALTINALAAASNALVVTEPTFLALHAMEELFDTLRDVAEERNPSLEMAGVVLNRVETTAEHKHSVAEVQESFGSQVWEPHIPKRAILQDAMRRGVPPQDLQSHSHYAIEVAEIFDALALRIEAFQAKQ